MQWGLDVAWFQFLLALGMVDIKNLSVPKWYLIYGGGLTIMSVHIEGRDILDIVIGGILGMGFLLVSKYTKEALGYGDSIMISLVALRFGGYVAIYILAGSFGMAAIYGGIRRWRRSAPRYVVNEIDVPIKKDGNVTVEEPIYSVDEVPFLPFLAVACTWGMILC